METEMFFLQAFITLGLSFIMIYALIKNAKHPPITLNGRTTLRVNKVYYWIGWSLMAICLVGMTCAFFYADEEWSVLLPLATFLIPIGGIGYYYVLFSRNHKVEFDDNQIIVSNWRGIVYFIAWDEISNISCSNLGYLKIKYPQGNIKMSTELVGLKSFTQMMEQKTKWRAKELKIPVL